MDEISPSRPSQHAREPVYFSEAIRRLEERLGPTIWLEAGTNSPISAMVKAAVASPNDHTFLSMKVPDAQAPTKVLSSTVINLWREGLPISHWKFIPSKGLRSKPVWLPPYQFRPTSHWLANVDRVIEAQKSIPETVKSDNEPIREPSRLVTAKNPSAGEFYININTQRFKAIVSGHAVRQRPLCPASLYMECVVLALEMLNQDIKAKALHFGELVFQSPLGIDMNREVILTLDTPSSGFAWDFVVKSVSRTDPKSRFTTHAKGSVSLTTQPKFQAYEGLIKDTIDEVERKPMTEKLMAKRAYGLFAQVVSYSYFLKGISQISLSGKQAVGAIEVPEVDLGANETTVLNDCDTIPLDTFIQVLGLLMNSSDMVTEGEVMIASGIEHISMSSSMNFSGCRSWTVYAKYIDMGNGRATGDVFVLTRDGTLVMILTGCQFNKLQISKLEKALDSANSEAANSSAPKDKVTSKSLTVSSDPTPVPSSEIAPALSSASSDDGDDGPKTPDSGVEEGTESLKNILSEYTGVSTGDITEDATLGELGVDSLAAVEMAEELSSKFGKDIESGDLLTSSYGGLVKIYQLSTSIKPLPTATITLPPSSTEKKAMVSEVASMPPSQHGDLLKILSETSGCAVPDIEGSASLQQIGVDSLAAVELKSELEDVFSVTIEDDQFGLESTVKEIAQFLGVGLSNAQTALTGSTPSVPKVKQDLRTIRSLSPSPFRAHTKP